MKQNQLLEWDHSVVQGRHFPPLPLHVSQCDLPRAWQGSLFAQERREILLAVNRQMKRKDDFVPPVQGHFEVLAPVLVPHTLCAHSHWMALNNFEQLYEQNQEPVLSALSSKRLFFWLNSARAPAIKLSVQPHLTSYLCIFITITTWSSRLLVQVWIGIFMYFLEGGAPKR